MSPSTDAALNEEISLQKIPMYPFRFEPIYKDYVWGGSRMNDVFKRSSFPRGKVAESWEVVDHENGGSVISNGPFAGISLHEIASSRPEGIFGIESHLFDRFGRFPLMLKYISAEEMTSVQVHPKEMRARELGYPDTGKSEAWVVVDAAPDSVMNIGFNQQYSESDIASALQEGRIESLLHRIKPKVGDCYLIEPGVVHSVGKGVLLAEVQQTSDMAFRLFDWNRKDERGKERPLQIEQALKAIDYKKEAVSAQKPYPTEYRGCERLVICNEFTLNRWRFDDMMVWSTDNRCHIWTVLQGCATAIFHLGRRGTPENVSGRQSDPIAMECLKRGDSLLVPNSCRSIQWTADSDTPVILLDVYGT